MVNLFRGALRIYAATLLSRPALRLEELQEAIGKIKKGKAPGPDGIAGELFQMLDHTVESELLQVYNDLRATPDIPQTWLEEGHS